ncbi:MAG: lysophospholipid acyltransferase family protein [Bacteroidota bacterium]|nr:lysophospholipid acyltransferase family protein [Bacteroidota bacterium]
MFAFIAYRVIKYRKKVVLNNLKNSFPEKTNHEISQIAKAYYLNLADISLETIKSLTISPAVLRKKVKINNLELLEAHLKRGSSVITMTSHQGNWEWLLLSNSLEIKNGDVVAAFQEVSSLSGMMQRIRTKFGATLIEKKNMAREMMKGGTRPKVYALVADQSPSDLTNRYWTHFLNQDTPFFTGAEKIAIKCKLVVLYVYMRRVKRGFYEVDFSEIGCPPYKGLDFSITKAYAKNVEKGIIENPSQWLWSHKRWKNIKKAKDENN